MALRMINGTFDQFEVKQYGQGGLSFEEDHEKTTVDAWFKPYPDTLQRFDSESAIHSNQGMIFGQGQHAEFKVGSIIKSAYEIQTDMLLTFYLFKVTIGRAYVKPVPANKERRDKLAAEPVPEDYDSVYLQEEQQTAGLFCQTYAIHNCEKIRLLYKVTTKIKVNPLNQNAQTDIKDCAVCGEKADCYCINDMSYFCNEHYEEVHSAKFDFFRDHKRVPVEHRPRDFGFCDEHQKMYEFYSNENSKAYCSQCIVKHVQNGSDQNNTIPIE